MGLLDRRRRGAPATSEGGIDPSGENTVVLRPAEVPLERNSIVHVGRAAMGLPEIDYSEHPEELRREFRIQLEKVINYFDHVDHEYGPMGGTELQDDCQVIRMAIGGLPDIPVPVEHEVVLEP